MPNCCLAFTNSVKKDVCHLYSRLYHKAKQMHSWILALAQLNAVSQSIKSFLILKISLAELKCREENLQCLALNINLKLRWLHLRLHRSWQTCNIIRIRIAQRTSRANKPGSYKMLIFSTWESSKWMFLALQHWDCLLFQLHFGGEIRASRQTQWMTWWLRTLHHVVDIPPSFGGVPKLLMPAAVATLKAWHGGASLVYHKVWADRPVIHCGRGCPKTSC